VLRTGGFMPFGGRSVCSHRGTTQKKSITPYKPLDRRAEMSLGSYLQVLQGQAEEPKDPALVRAAG
jgi:hypothetical protein